jgi:hypothetical protein
MYEYLCGARALGIHARKTSAFPTEGVEYEVSGSEHQWRVTRQVLTAVVTKSSIF